MERLETDEIFRHIYGFQAEYAWQVGQDLDEKELHRRVSINLGLNNREKMK